MSPRAGGLCVALAWLVAAAPQAAGQGLQTRIDTLMASGLREGMVAGGSVAVFKDGRLVAQGGYGFADLENRVPATPATWYRLGPITEVFTASAAMRLVESGSLRLEEDVADSVPELARAGRHATLAQLLSHTSGLPDAIGAKALDYLQRDVSPGMWLQLYASEPPDFQPGAGWGYSRLGYYAAQQVVEHAARKPLELLDREHPGDSLPAWDSRLYLVDHRAHGYEIYKNRLVIPRYVAASGFGATGLGWTAPQLARWVDALRSGRLISEGSLARMLTPTRLADGTTVGAGLGVRLGSLEGHSLWGQCGSGQGFSSAVVVYPSDQLVIVVLCNTDSPLLPAWQLEERIARVVLDLPPGTTLDLPTPPSDLSTFAGRWISSGEALQIYEDQGHLVVARPGSSNLPLLYQGDGRYFIYGPEHELRFAAVGGRSAWILHYEAGLFMSVDRAR